ncbi:MAG: NUDIX domain-containing protein [Peptostreptococcaceae bacterium]|nr:NUDIX domain-containing protein [Peptostreptococcaceae bacterium]
MNEISYLKSYRTQDYEKLSLTTDILIFTLDREHRLQILLSRRTQFPYKGFWALPGGFVQIDASLEEEASRVLREKTGLSDLHLEQLYTFGDKDRDPRMRIVTVAYLALMPRDSVCRLEKEAEFFRIEEGESELIFHGSCRIEEGSLAFDHSRIIRLALQRMKGKLHYTDIALRLLKDPNRFTIFELQKIYETIENKSYDTPNFRRYFKTRYESTGIAEKTEESGTEFSKRPSSYYRLAKP